MSVLTWTISGQLHRVPPHTSLDSARAQQGWGAHEGAGSRGPLGTNSNYTYRFQTENPSVAQAETGPFFKYQKQPVVKSGRSVKSSWSTC